jgi:hypothetical protein
VGGHDAVAGAAVGEGQLGENMAYYPELKSDAARFHVFLVGEKAAVAAAEVARRDDDRGVAGRSYLVEIIG